ncbi:MAG: rod shape-determining protein MreD [Candidatus Cloacimonetes bacterium]|nr:rod shape-determining protein MreD [Candidatus Cloacimonadota bacterium]
MRIIKYILLGIIVLYFQIMFASGFILFGIIPNFLIAYLVFTNLNLELRSSSFIAFFIGIAFDLIQPSLLGLHTISFLVISFFVSNYHKSINKERFDIVALSILALNIFHFLLISIFYLASAPFEIKMIGNLLLAIIYNFIVTFIVTYIFFLLSRIRISLKV